MKFRLKKLVIDSNYRVTWLGRVFFLKKIWVALVPPGRPGRWTPPFALSCGERLFISLVLHCQVKIGTHRLLEVEKPPEGEGTATSANWHYFVCEYSVPQETLEGRRSSSSSSSRTFNPGLKTLSSTRESMSNVRARLPLIIKGRMHAFSMTAGYV